MRFACLAILILCSVALAVAQQPAQDGAAKPAAAPASATKEVVADTAKAPLTAQEKQLADDTAKLLALANDLKTELDKSNKDTLSLSVIKKAQQVEKLARRVRDEMKASMH